jgi:hypothetical protein
VPFWLTGTAACRPTAACATRCAACVPCVNICARHASAPCTNAL